MADKVGPMTTPVKINFSKRVFSQEPPIIGRPKLPDDLGGYSTVEELMDKLPSNGVPAFPYERELALYLLLVASLWPKDRERLLTAARIFSGALNFHFSRARGDGTSTSSKKYAVLGRELSSANIDSFNESFFARIGGPLSLLFCPSIEESHRALWKQVGELTMKHDFVEYLFKSSPFKRISSVTFAYHAIANNIFERKGGYGVAGGPKRKRGEADPVKTAESVRARCKDIPENVILSFIMTRWCCFHWLDPTYPEFLLNLMDSQVSSSFIKGSVATIEERVRSNKSTVTTSLARWAPTKTPRPNRAWLQTLSPDELERAFAISTKAFPKKPLTQQEKDSARAILNTRRSAMEVEFRPRQ
jgi:hypothetical protein